MVVKMLDGKLIVCNEIKAFIEKFTDNGARLEVSKALNKLSEEHLQKINRYSSVFNFLVLKDIETECHKGVDFQINSEIECNLLNKSENELDKITKRKELFNILEPKHRYLLNELLNLNDEQFARVMEEPRFIKALVNIGMIDQNVLGSHVSCLSFFQRGVEKLNQSFDGCMDNKDLFLIYSLLLKKACTINLSYIDAIKFMYCSNRESMKEALCNLRQCIQEAPFSGISDEEKVYNEQTFNLMISNSKAIEQILYSDVDGSITKKLKYPDYEGIKALINYTSGQSLGEIIKQDPGPKGFKYGGEFLVKGTKFDDNPKKLETISAMKFMENENQEHFVQAYSKKYSKCEESYKEDVEEKAQQRKVAKLNQVRVTQDKEKGR